jgi:hypothetical protein
MRQIGGNMFAPIQKDNGEFFTAQRNPDRHSTAEVLVDT